MASLLEDSKSIVRVESEKPDTTKVIKVSFTGIVMIKPVDIFSREEEECGWVVGFEKEGIDIYGYGDSREEALDHFWSYVYDLIPILISEKDNLTKDMKSTYDYLLEHFEVK